MNDVTPPPPTVAGDAQPQQNRRPRQPRPRPRREPHRFDSGWSENYNPSYPLPEFNPRPRLDIHDHEPGPINIPTDINPESEAKDFLNLFLDDTFWTDLVNFTNIKQFY